MARYAIGDIQGCYHSFEALLRQIKFDPKHDVLWLVGDIINRGTGSLAVLRWCVEHQSCLRMVLGNHDLHAIAVFHGIKPAHRSDTLQEIFEHSEGNAWLDWLRCQPMMYQEQDFTMVHAGLLPQWSLQQAGHLAQEVEQVLQGQDYLAFLQQMYGNQPDTWDDALTGIARLRLITNALTRLRVCNAQGQMEFSFKGELKDIPAGLYPWFAVPKPTQYEKLVLFGHWSALGLHMKDGVIGLDSGCLWGRSLTAYCLETGQISQVPLDVRDKPVISAG